MPSATHIAVGVLSAAIAAGLIWLLIRAVETGVLDFTFAGSVIREEQPARFWVLVTGLLVVAVVLLLLAAALLVTGPVTVLVR